MIMLEMEPLPGSQFITITLPPQAYKLKARQQYDMCKDTLRVAFSHYTQNYCLVPELTEAANVHFHGWFTEAFDGSTLLLLDQLKGCGLGFVKINKERIKMIDRTYKYMMKSLDITRKVLHTKTLILSSYHKFVIPPEDKPTVIDQFINKYKPLD